MPARRINTANRREESRGVVHIRASVRVCRDDVSVVIGQSAPLYARENPDGAEYVPGHGDRDVVDRTMTRSGAAQ